MCWFPPQSHQLHFLTWSKFSEHFLSIWSILSDFWTKSEFSDTLAALSVHQSGQSFVCPSVCPSVCFCPSVCPSVGLFRCQSVSQSFLFLSVHLSFHPSVHPSVCLSIGLSIHQYVGQSVVHLTVVSVSPSFASQLVKAIQKYYLVLVNALQ